MIVAYSKDALKQLDILPDRFRDKVQSRVESLNQNPFLGKMLFGQLQGIRAIRIWPYRVLYKIDHQKKLVVIVSIVHRQGAYK